MNFPTFSPQLNLLGVYCLSNRLLNTTASFPNKKHKNKSNTLKKKEEIAGFFFFFFFVWFLLNAKIYWQLPPVTSIGIFQFMYHITQLLSPLLLFTSQSVRRGESFDRRDYLELFYDLQHP